MYDRMSIQAEVDYRRERLTKGKPVKRTRGDRTRIPFVGDQVGMARRVR